MLDQAKDFIHLTKQKLARAKDFCHFIIKSRLFYARPIFLHFFNMLLTFFQFFWHVSGTKTFWCPSGGYKIVLLSFRLGFVVPRETFCPSGLSRYAQWTPLRTKSLPQDNKAQPSGQKTILYPPSGHQNVFVPLRCQKNWKNVSSILKKSAKNLAGHKKAWSW